MNKYPLLTVLDQLHEFYGVDNIDPDTIITYCLSGLKKIGNNNFVIKAASLKVFEDKENRVWYANLPCNVLEIISVVLPFESGKTVDAVKNDLGVYTFDVENWIERFRVNRSLFYLPGTFVKYQLVGDKIYFGDPYNFVNILYKQEILDEDNLPMISDKELEALTTYCMYCLDYKKARVSKDQNMLTFAQQEYAQWQKQCSNARTPDYISNNEMNELLDALTSRDVHQYGVSSTKPIQ